MNAINGKPTGDMVAYGARTGNSIPNYGMDTVDMTFAELEALWRKVRPDGRQNNRK